MAQDDTNTEPRNTNARGRLEALKARRAAGKGGPGLLAAAPGGRGGRGGAAAGGAMGAGAGGKAGGKGGRLRAMFASPENAQKRKALMKLVLLMRNTPDDGTGMVAGTPFSKAGVKKVVDTLQTRAKDGGGQGGKAATVVLRLLTTAGQDGDGGGETVHGVQVNRLAKLAQLANR